MEEDIKDILKKISGILRDHQMILEAHNQVLEGILKIAERGTSKESKKDA